MKRYLKFLRSMSTVSLMVLYSFTTFFSPFSATAEENIHSENTVISIDSTESVWVAEEQISEVQLDEYQEEDTKEIIKEEDLSDLSTGDETTIFFAEGENSIVSPNVTGLVGGVECTAIDSPVVTFKSRYADTQPGGAEALLSILTQIEAVATDPEDGIVTVTTNLSSFFPFISGWHAVTFSAVDSDGCVTEELVDIFIFGNDYSPACSTGEVYLKVELPVEYKTVLGTNSLIYSDQWFPVMYKGGTTLSEDENEILVAYDISIARNGNFVYINVGAEVPDSDGVAQSIADSLEITGGEIISSIVFSGSVAVIEFSPTECVYECTVDNGPSIVYINDSITISENNPYTVDEVLALYGIITEDLDGEGDVTISSDISPEVLTVPGVYIFIITLIDNEDCVLSYTLTLVVEKTTGGDEDEENGGGGSGCVNPNGCGGGGGNNLPDEPEGEVLGASVCEAYITTFIQMGQPNLKEDIVRLQIFLNDHMEENLVVDGVYGIKTFEAVKRFQVKEGDEILAPWGITEATGIVRDTTRRRINNIMCPELQIQMPILYCVTTGRILYPDGRSEWPDPQYIIYEQTPVIQLIK